ncbi:undecaprenyl-phosphate glucose phosphotransferase [Agaricicola taiwanensis]|uniref:Undecaprenyl-phosphate glucose phosphotransferase n=1 Tax=Agaricicola taiwanensis TaxID=591372 RepID=A0A8J2YJD0_9RHOB|nr:undecaprenyl-phosphate glucose phosphotransferase [Agaricicola taiwanensis]GGE46078.1 undecaprenyl-phosphate glucose phosphotransferase [Agaricicola taiwanensis]
MFGLSTRDALPMDAGPTPADAGPPAIEISPLPGTPATKTTSPVVLAGVVRLAEAALIVTTGLIGLLPNLLVGESWLKMAVPPIVALVYVLLGEAAHLFSVPLFRQRGVQLLRVMAVVAMVCGLLIASFAMGSVLTVENIGWLERWLAILAVVLVLFRLSTHHLVKAWSSAGRLARRTAIVGGGEAGEKLIRELEARAVGDVTICGVFDDRSDIRSPDSVAGHAKLGTVEDLVTFARRTKLDLVIFTLPITAEGRILQMLKKLWVLPVDIRLSAHTNKLQFRPRSYSYLGSVPVLDVLDRPIADWDIVQKWLFDRIVGGLALLALSPIFLVTAIAIKLTSNGPVLFRQRRYGFNNELIEVFKFRSMYIDQCDATASKLVTKDDPRVTPVGRFIRKTSIDELPQLFNVVFKGNLSLVGPRPHAIHAKAVDRLYNDVVDGYFARHKVKPGITGWAQINGWRGETDTEEKIQQRVAHDLYYIENWSVFFDLKILAMTPLSLVSTENAY